jgi:hypothetical protein
LALAVPALGGPSNPIASVSASVKQTATKALKKAKAAQKTANSALSAANSAQRCNPGVTDEDVVSGDNCDREFPEGLNGSRLPAFRQLNLRLTKGFALGGVDLTAYLDARNVLNFRNIIQVFTQTDDIVNDAERENEFLGNQEDNLDEATRSGVPVSADGDIDLTFGGIPDPRTGCSSWVTQDGLPGAPNCIYMIRAEERWGNGDHLYTVAEQRRASDALYNTIRGTHNFTGEPRRMRLGVELNF